jgi:hypothetical protein
MSIRRIFGSVGFGAPIGAAIRNVPLGDGRKCIRRSQCGSASGRGGPFSLLGFSLLRVDALFYQPVPFTRLLSRVGKAHSGELAERPRGLDLVPGIAQLRDPDAPTGRRYFDAETCLMSIPRHVSRRLDTEPFDRFFGKLLTHGPALLPIVDIN